LPLVVSLLVLAPPHDTTAQDATRAGVVVAYPGGEVREACVDLPAGGATGMDLLRLAGFDAVAEVTSLGSKVCSIDGAGCDYPAEPCWCECRSLGAECTYWIYHQMRESGWVYSALGASARRVQPGEVDGWAWGAGGEGFGAAPPPRTFDEVCAAPPTDAPPTDAPPATTEPDPTDSSEARPTAAPTENVDPTPVPATAPTGTVEPAATATATSLRPPGAAATPSAAEPSSDEGLASVRAPSLEPTPTPTPPPTITPGTITLVEPDAERPITAGAGTDPTSELPRRYLLAAAAAAALLILGGLVGRR
jgi:hypothetical protein